MMGLGVGIDYALFLTTRHRQLLSEADDPAVAIRRTLAAGASVIIDATIIRLLIVPSLMFVFDRANWWMPRWLDRPHPSLEPEATTPHAAKPSVAPARP
jgi:uncharacterized membrane protein YdfJ with MMPL/SSD domain